LELVSDRAIGNNQWLTGGFMVFNAKVIVATAALVLGACPGSGQAQSTGVRHMVLYRPSNSTFYVRHGDATAVELPFGAVGDIPLWADFDGKGQREPALYRKGQWLISTHADGKADMTVAFGGQPGEVPLAADVDGDGKADLVVFRAGEWLVRGTRNPALTQIFHFGAAGDVPLLGDIDGDGKVDLIVFRNGLWLVDTRRDGKADLTFAFGGVAGERALAVDWDGGDHVVPVLFRNGIWLVSAKRDGNVSSQLSFGARGDIPVAVWSQK
jgi:hypothetical protein